MRRVAPAVRHLLPLSSEVRWSDLLAALIETDPDPVAEIFGLPADAAVRVRREEVPRRGDRVDLVISVDGEQRTVVEVKVLSGVTARQLSGYEEAFPDVATRLLVFLERLLVTVPEGSAWRPVTWEELMRAFAGSADAWVAQTARAWLAHLEESVPALHSGTRWNDLTPGEDFVVALRARMTWVYQHLAPVEGVDHDLLESAAGVSWVAMMSAPAAVPGYSVLVETEETLPVRDFPKYASSDGYQPRGPSIKVCLRQDDVTTSAGFDWNHLHHLWTTVMEPARSDWVTNSASPRAPHDRAAWQAMVARGAPKHLGIGFGDAQARLHGACMFGARRQLSADITLEEVAREMDEMSELVVELASTPPVEPGS